jgi:hypothetical protein
MIASFYDKIYGSFKIIEETFRHVCEHNNIEYETFTTGPSEVEESVRISVDSPIPVAYWAFTRRLLGVGIEGSKVIFNRYKKTGLPAIFTDVRLGFGFGLHGFNNLLVHPSFPIHPLKSEKVDRCWYYMLSAFHRANQTKLSVWDKYTADTFRDYGYDAHFMPLLLWPELPEQNEDKEYDILMITSRAHSDEKWVIDLAKELKDYSILVKSYPPDIRGDQMPDNVTFKKGFAPREEYLKDLSKCSVYVQFSTPSIEVFGIRAVEAAYFMPVVYIDNGVTPFYKKWATTHNPDNPLSPTIQMVYDNYDNLRKQCHDFSTQYTTDNVIDQWSPVLDELDQDVPASQEDLGEWFS